MKKSLIFLVLLALVLALSAASAEEQPVGGWENVPHEAAVLPDRAQAAFDKAVEAVDGMAYTPVALLSTQVVAGTNYCIICQVAPVVPEPRTGWALVYIYADLQGGAEITNVYELYIPRHATPAE